MTKVYLLPSVNRHSNKEVMNQINEASKFGNLKVVFPKVITLHNPPPEPPPMAA